MSGARRCWWEYSWPEDRGAIGPDGVRLVIPARAIPTLVECRRGLTEAHQVARDLHDGITGAHYRRDQQARFLAILRDQQQQGATPHRTHTVKSFFSCKS